MRHICLIILMLVSFSISAQMKDLGHLFSKGKHEKVIEKGLVFLEQDSENPEVNSVVGRSYIALNKYEEGIPYLKKGLIPIEKKMFVMAWSLADLGVAYYHTGKVKEAVKSFKDAIAMKATRNCTRYAHKMLMRFQENKFFQKWNLRETEHIRFHFQDEMVIENIEQYMAQHEKAYENINHFFKAELSKKIDLFVWKDREEAYDMLGRPLGFASSKRKIINAWYKQTKGHEICHILCDIAVKPTKKSKLINEGICVYFDQTIRNKMDEARKAFPEEGFHLLELWESPTEYERGLSYPIGGAFIDFLYNKEGKTKLMLLLKDQTIENAEKIYPDFENLVRTFEAMIHR